MAFATPLEQEELLTNGPPPPFFIMGCHVWGWCYVMGLVFMFLATIMGRHPHSEWGPLWFGSLWGLALATLGYRFWRPGSNMSIARCGVLAWPEDE